jgi:hypothetical protein
LPPISHNEVWLIIIESQSIINNRFFDIKRISPDGGNGQFSLVFIAKDNQSKRKKEVVLKFYNPKDIIDYVEIDGVMFIYLNQRAKDYTKTRYL